MKGHFAGAAWVRGAAFLALWAVLIGLDPVDLAAGVVAAACAAWASLRLLPPGARWPRPAALATLAARFLWQSIVAGWDVARRALDPRLPIKPGFVAYPVRLPPGAARGAFASLSSLLPGTVPCGEDDGAIVYHCLDVDQPVAAQLAAEEALLTRALGGGRDGTD
jgi:multicomponent Na+:H+ antiporter subunit E